MPIVTGKIYKYLQTAVKIRILYVDPGADLAVVVKMECQSAKPRPVGLAELNDQLSAGRLLPYEMAADEVPDAILSDRALKKGKLLQEAFEPLIEIGPVALSQRILARDFHKIAESVNMTYAGVNSAFTRVLQAGMVLRAAIPRWHLCGRLMHEVDGTKLRARPTRQPGAYPLSLQDIANIQRGVRKHKVGKATWSEAHNETLKEFYPSSIKVVGGEEIVVPKPPLHRPSFGQFRSHGRRIGTIALLTLKYGKEGFEANHAGKPIGQASSASMPGRIADLDWTTTGLVTVRRGNRQTVGTLVVYVIVDRYSGEIMALYLTLANASYEEASRACLQCLEDKVELCGRYRFQIEPKDWPVRHLPTMLAVDRGEMNSWKSSSIVTGLGVSVKMTRTRMGKDKGTVESVNAQIKFALRRHSGGVWRFRDRATEKPQLSAIFDFDQVYRLLLSLAVKFNKRLRRRQPLTEEMVDEGIDLRPTANRVWEYGVSRGMVQEMDLNLARVRVLPFREAAVTERGLEIDGLRFTIPDGDCEEPGAIDASEWLATARKKRWKVRLGIDNATVRHVWLHHAPKGLTPLLIKCPLSLGQEAYSALTWPEYLLRKKQIRAAFKEYIEGDLRDATSVDAAIIKDTNDDASRATKQARAGLSKSQIMKGIDGARAMEVLERSMPPASPRRAEIEIPFVPYVPALPKSFLPDLSENDEL